MELVQAALEAIRATDDAADDHCAADDHGAARMRYFSSRSVSDGSATRILRARKTFFLGISSRHTAHPAAAAAATSASLCFMPKVKCVLRAKPFWEGWESWSLPSTPQSTVFGSVERGEAALDGR